MTNRGKPIKILLSLLGLDQHEAGAFAVSRLLRDAGMEVVYLGRYGIPDAIVRAAIQEGVDVIGLSCHSWEYIHYLDDLFAIMKDKGVDLPVVVGGSVLTTSDKAQLLDRGVAAAFGPSAKPDEITQRFVELAHR